jgi:hypothetical protein
MSLSDLGKTLDSCIDVMNTKQEAVNAAQRALDTANNDLADAQDKAEAARVALEASILQQLPALDTMPKLVRPN